MKVVCNLFSLKAVYALMPNLTLPSNLSGNRINFGLRKPDKLLPMENSVPNVGWIFELIKIFIKYFSMHDAPLYA